MALPELVVPKETARALYELTGEARPDVALLIVLRDARAYLLKEIEDEIRRFEAKYGMSFEDYDAHIEQDDPEEAYAWEAESDYLMWEAMVMRRRRLAGTTLA
jgi:hypothetical protein